MGKTIGWPKKNLPMHLHRKVESSIREGRSGGALLAGQENVLGAGIFQHLARALRCMHALTVDGDKDAAGLDLLFVAPGFNLGKSEADETSGYASHRATYAGSRQCGDDRSCSEQRSHTGNGQRANTNQPAQSTAYQQAGAAAGHCAFRSLGVLLQRELFVHVAIGKDHRDVIAEKSLFTETV